MTDRRGFLGVALGSLAAASMLSPAGAAEPRRVAAMGGPDDRVSLRARYAFSIAIFFKERVHIDSERGRAFVPAVGGEIWGPRLQGKVVPYGGADYASGGFDAHYMLQASDGALIYINNHGSLQRLDAHGRPVRMPPRPPEPPPPPGKVPDQRMKGNALAGIPLRFRTTPIFDAPRGPHEWMNSTVFIGHAARHVNPDHSIFTYYEVL